MDEIIRPEIKKHTKPTKSDDAEILEWLRPFAERIEISVEELALNIHVQTSFKFDNIHKLLNLEYFKEEDFDFFK